MTVLDYAKPKLTKTMLRALNLKKGAHGSRDKGMCVMEAVAWAAGREHSDHPPCVSPVIGAFLRNWNDSLDDEGRQMLKPYVFRVVGTATGKKDEETRAWLATDWLVRECAPAWLRLAGLTEQAESLENLAALTNGRRAKSAQEKIDAARDAARDAAGDAARAAAWDAAGDAAWAAAWDATWDATRAAARAAAWAAAGAAAWDAAWAAARDAARAAAGAAARAAARAAAWAAAKESLVPTTKGLQKSALLLLDRMIEVGK
jgi:hypothetical protein